MLCIQKAVTRRIPKEEQLKLQARIIEELRRMHEGVLARYGVRPSEFAKWKKVIWLTKPASNHAGLLTPRS
jgi:hypothetical protein